MELLDSLTQVGIQGVYTRRGRVYGTPSGCGMAQRSS